MSEAKEFKRTYLVRVNDINYGGHMGNERALVVFQDARIAFLESVGCEERRLAEGIGSIIVEAKIEYRKQVFMGDELETGVKLRIAGSSALDFVFAARRVSDGAEVFSGTTRVLPFSYTLQKVRKVPEEFLRKIEAYVVA